MLKSLNQSGSVALIIFAVVAVLAVGGAGAYVATDGFGTQKTNQNNVSTQSSENGQQSEAQEAQPSGSVALLESALTGGDAVKCTYEEADNSGTAYIASENKFRVDYTSAEGSGHMVLNGETMYVWADGESQGFKITNPKDSTDDIAEEYNEYSPETLKENYNEDNLNCEKFSFDDSLVELPANVQFQSFEELLQNIPSGQ